MRNFFFHSLAFVFISSASLTFAVEQQQQQQAPSEQLNAELSASQIAAKAFLGLLDAGKYGESWDSGSQLMKHTIKRKEWDKAMTKLRKPKGSVSSRTVLDQRTAKDPANLPKGDYMVLFYKTDFSSKPNAYELITLYHEGDGQWRVVTYQVD